jgi:hypothetical protein
MCYPGVCQAPQESEGSSVKRCGLVFLAALLLATAAVAQSLSAASQETFAGFSG